MHSKCYVFLTLFAVAFARSAGTQRNSVQDEGRSDNDVSSYLGDIKFMYKTYQECAIVDLASCLKLKLVTALDRASRSFSDISVVDGVTFVKDNSAPVDETPVKSESEIEASLPRSLNEKEDTLNGLILEKIFNFFSTHTLQMKLPSSEEFQRSLTEEGRGRRKKYAPLLLIPLLIGGTLVPLAFGALALLAGKALIVSKLALVLAGIIGLKKLLSGGGHHDSGHEVVVSAGHGGAGWGRAAQEKAYNAYVPAQPSS